MLLRSGKSYTFKPKRKTNKKTKITKSVKSYVNKTIDRKQELKEYLEMGTSSTCTALTQNTWTSDLLFAVPQGDDNQSRVGDKVRISSIYCGTNFSFQQDTETGTDAFEASGMRQFRCIVVQLKRGFTIAEFIAQLPTTSISAPLNKLDIQRRGYILADRRISELSNKTYVISQATVATSVVNVNQEVHNLTFHLKPKIDNLIYDSDTITAVAPDIQGALYMLYLWCQTNSSVYDSAVAVQEQPDVRVTYRDA